MIDTHCHLDADRLVPDQARVLERAWHAGLEAIVVPGVAPAQWEALTALGNNEPRLWIALGIHPQFLPELPEGNDSVSLEQLDAMLARGGCVAVGECGLDGASLPGAPLERQVKILRAHFALARKYELPLLLHCLRTHPALRQLLSEEKLPEAGAVLHSYSGGAELVKVYAKWDLYFSFAGPVSYPEARKPLDALRRISDDRLLAETDSPDQAPAPHRGQRSEPAYVAQVIDGMARALGKSAAEMRLQTTENARRFFRRAQLR